MLANTLGYIAYYGRCEDGIPDYETAYKYFSFAAFNGVYEAQYKIADMFQKGNGVTRSPETAQGMIQRLYNENLRYIQRGIFASKFADVALRMGGLFADLESRSFCSFTPLLKEAWSGISSNANRSFSTFYIFWHITCKSRKAFKKTA